MAEVFNLELHDGDNLIESDDDIIEVDEVSGFGFSVYIIHHSRINLLDFYILEIKLFSILITRDKNDG